MKKYNILWWHQELLVYSDVNSDKIFIIYHKDVQPDQ